ncbi:MAG: hypothetical protein AAF202_05105 [Pseudomonadota bacterium]
MKSIVVLIAGLLSVAALAYPGEVEKLIKDFEPLLEAEAQASDFEVLDLGCGSAYGGIICGATIRIFDTVSHGASQGGGEEVCKERYSYRGGDKYFTDCSDCSYASYYGIKACNP